MIGLSIFEHSEQLSAFDAALAAGALAAGATHLVSADTAFAGVPGLTTSSPTRTA